MNRTCPPCTGDCEQGDACPARTSQPLSLLAKAAIALAVFALFALIGALV